MINVIEHKQSVMNQKPNTPEHFLALIRIIFPIMTNPHRLFNKQLIITFQMGFTQTYKYLNDNM